ncbi:hypothetical protein ACNFX6_06565 [Acinetobacter johnsonii]|uniref:hypothetical protein n=1 Tax=Acinetobacter johnsonii TaxID=40214 RepID=UPI003CF0C30C
MSDFEEYIKVNYPRDYERQKRIYPDQRVEELYSEDYKMWNHQQTIIDDLKAQLNNMEACYIGKKKQVEDQQGRVSKALNFINNWWHPDLDQKLFVEAVANALRGES